ncbi:MAG TPA: major capsid protein P2 [Ignavibacteriaceae bacterium]|nr:major capsid protein P2 [Ignavibacteriaceae bacterium]HRQ54205.1 major capsid protein P2 [Ignavibacteriaceae bacterium]
MKNVKIYFLLIVLFSFVVNAQNIYKIPVGSTDNSISIKVTNPTNEIMQNVQVNLISSPEWIKFNNETVIIENLASRLSENALFTFSVNENAADTEEGTIIFSIQTTNNQNWQKQFKVQAVLPDKFELQQNYPNPFNPNTIIKFSLPKDNFVTLRVFNILGETVKLLVNEEQKAGIHNIEFNASSLASGVYFYSIEAGDFKAVRKMMLMK